MADYINRDEVLKRRETVTTDDYSGNEILEVVLVEEILGLTPEDVVEREKYDELKGDYKLSVEAHKQSIRLYDKRVKELEVLNSKIDKAIAEMREEYDNFTYSSANKTLGASFGIRKAIEILEKNLGE